VSASSAVPLPRDADDITAEWLTSALNAGGHDTVVKSFRLTPLGEGVGMMSHLARVEIEDQQGDAPATLVLKMPAPNEANRAVADVFDLYRREVLFYRDVAPRSTAYTPRIFHADIEGNDFVLLMEDLSEYRLGDQVVGCDLQQARDGMVWLGRQHAAFWDRVDDPSLDFLPYVYPSFSSDGLRQGCEAGWDAMVEAFADVLPEHVRGLKDRYLAALPGLFGWMATPPLTVIQGDFRMDNLFFGAHDAHEPLIAVDWQGCLRGRATQDVGYFMSGSLPIELRRAHERELIGLWHAELVANGVTGYSVEDAWEDYRRGVLYVWVIAVVIAGTLDRTNERGTQWMSEMLARSVAAIDDLGLVELLDEMGG
jgi:hypothetical protein